jgi:hypothetical protein
MGRKPLGEMAWQTRKDGHRAPGPTSGLLRGTGTRVTNGLKYYPSEEIGQAFQPDSAVLSGWKEEAQG